MAFPIQLDATRLTITQFAILGVTGWLDAKLVQTVQLDMGKYHIQTPAGIDTSWTFEVSSDGTLAFDPVLAHERGGFLDGNGTTCLVIIGYAITIDGGTYRGTGLVLKPFGMMIDTTAPVPTIVSLLPQSDLSLALSSTPPKEVVFDLHPNGAIALREPYPYVELGQAGDNIRLRLIQQEFRQKRPCRRPGSTPLRIAAEVQKVTIVYDPPGNDVDGEYVLTRNNGDHPVHLDGWTLRDTSKHVYTFPSFTLRPGLSVSVWTKAGTDDTTNLYQGRKQAVWNNRGDTGVLCDARGIEVGRYTYSR